MNGLVKWWLRLQIHVFREAIKEVVCEMDGDGFFDGNGEEM